jgi:hypothetical protein
MTGFKKFCNTRKFWADLRRSPIADDIATDAGFTYEEAYFILMCNGSFSLIIANTEFISDDLTELEAELYAYVVAHCR